ncbi:MAG: HDOD domain-containing protein [Acidobacteria bacterium]|nr:HDOD domain-containing protein [Acidobacteriota bacterium]
MSKPRILFVDDEALVLKGLQRSLHGMRDQWEMSFQESAALGLESLDREGFDVVVSDMRMPVMNGAEFLNEVMVRHPHSARIILSGHADRDLILQCVGAAHQYLSKPCEPEVLRDAIARAFQSRPEVELEQVRGLLAGGEDLPVLPHLFRELQLRLEDPEASVDQVAEVVERDIAMTAKILKLTNSAFFGLRRSVASTREAIQVLGVDTIKSLILMDGFLNQVRAGLPRGLDLELVAQGSLDVGRMAKRIAYREAPAFVEPAFTAGLLSMSGLLVAARAQPKAYEDIITRLEFGEATLQSLERETLGVDHAQAGAYLLGVWALPATVVEGVRTHLKPSEGPPALHVGSILHGASIIQGKGRSPLWRMDADHEHFKAIPLRTPLDHWGHFEAEQGGDQ